MTIKRHINRLNKLQCADFTINCAESVLPIIQLTHPKEHRPKRVIAAAREWLDHRSVPNMDAVLLAIEEAKRFVDSIPLGEDNLGKIGRVGLAAAVCMAPAAIICTTDTAIPPILVQSLAVTASRCAIAAQRSESGIDKQNRRQLKFLKGLVKTYE